MTSSAWGAADLIAWRSSFKSVRISLGTACRYSSTVFAGADFAVFSIIDNFHCEVTSLVTGIFQTVIGDRMLAPVLQCQAYSFASLQTLLFLIFQHPYLLI